MSSDTRDSEATLDGGDTCYAGLPKCPDPAIRAEVLRRHREGMGCRKIAAWLKEQHGISVHFATVARYIEQTKAVRADFQHDPPAATPGPLAAPDLGPVQPEDELAAIKRDVMAEYREAAAEGDDWKRTQGALRLRLAVLSAQVKPVPQPEPPRASQSSEPEPPADGTAFRFN